MVERINRYGKPASVQLDDVCSSCGKSKEGLLQVDISNGYAIIFSGKFCDWGEYSEWKLKFDNQRKSKSIHQEGMG